MARRIGPQQNRSAACARTDLRPITGNMACTPIGGGEQGARIRQAHGLGKIGEKVAIAMRQVQHFAHREIGRLRNADEAQTLGLFDDADSAHSFASLSSPSSSQSAGKITYTRALRPSGRRSRRVKPPLLSKRSAQ